MKKIHVRLGKNSYDILLEQGCLLKADQYLNLNRKVMIVTDDGVPPVYARTLAGLCKEAVIHTIPQGEAHKTLETVEEVLRDMMQHDFTRKDCVVAVGGGLVGDLAGFSASAYMRGVDFYNIPTTVLSQVDSSIGGKTAVNLDHIKNIVGAFYQPKRVLIDIEVLKTLPKRQIVNGLVEALKMSVNFDPELFALFETRDPLEALPTIIERSLRIKEMVVHQDEKEGGLRKVLNFGHTIGHGIEAAAQEQGLCLYHGECVAMGMIPMCKDALRDRLLPILKKLGLQTQVSLPEEAVYEAMLHDKKSAGKGITMIFADELGTYRMEEIGHDSLKGMIRQVVREEKA